MVKNLVPELNSFFYKNQLFLAEAQLFLFLNSILTISNLRMAVIIKKECIQVFLPPPPLPADH